MSPTIDSVDQLILTPAEDTELRVLHGLREFGAAARSTSARYEDLRARDRRQTIRDLDETALAQPVPKPPLPVDIGPQRTPPPGS
jgi:hypothetical protein